MLSAKPPHEVNMLSKRAAIGIVAFVSISTFVIIGIFFCASMDSGIL